MSNSDYREINNALNNYYGNKMDLYEVGTEYREEYRHKMEEQKKLVKELSLKAEAFDRLRESYEYFSERKLKDVHGLGMDAYGIVGKYKTDSGEE